MRVMQDITRIALGFIPYYVFYLKMFKWQY
jgi:hypothetical protein